MATKKSTAVATRASGAIVSVKEMMAAQLAKLADKTAPATGNQIRVTQDKQFALPDGTKTRDPIELVILDFTCRNEWYLGEFDKEAIQPPACFAIGDTVRNLVPSNNSPQKQADFCKECPHDQWGSDRKGGRGKDCRNTRLLAVMPPEVQADTPIWTVKLSATAIKAFDAYVNSVKSMFGVPPIGVVSTMSFDDGVDYASVRFSEPKVNDNVGAHGARLTEAQTMLAQEPDVSNFSDEAPKKPAAKPVSRRPVATARR